MQLWLWTLLGAVVVFTAVAAVVAALGRGSVRAVAPEQEPPVAKPPPAASEPQPLPDVLVDPAVRIEKGRRLLTVFSAGEPVKRYRIALGREPVGDKRREGDLRTPEGEYYVCTRNAESNHHRALGLSYPNDKDADRGLAEGLISKREHRAIHDAMRRLSRPPWKTALGGEIMVHGGGSESDWTEGCIALSDDDAQELFNALPLGTPVTITE